MTPLSEQLEQFYIKNMPGMNNQIEDLDLKDKWVELAQNCRFEADPGSVDKRDPVGYYNPISTGVGPVTGLYRYYTSTGVAKMIKIHGTKCYVGDDSAGTWTAIRTSLTDGKRASFVTYKDLLIVSNGFDRPFVYDGSADNLTWELGSCKAKLGTVTGNLDASATYYYAVTFDTDALVTNAVSNTVTTTATARQIELTNIPLGPTGTANRKIYRTEGGGSALYLIATISNNTATTYTDNIADTTSTALPSITDNMPLGSILKIHRERLFISGDPNFPNRIYYSNVYLPHFIQQTTGLDYMEISADDNDEIMGIPIQLGVMLCIKKNTIRKLQITSATSGADPTTWYADDPVSFIGSPAQWSVTQTPHGVVFLGWDHWYVYDGAQLSPIISEFDTDDIFSSSYSDVVGFWHKGVMLAAYADGETASRYHDRIMHYNFKREALGIDQWTSSVLTGANCFASQTGDDETGELFYGDSQNGYVLKEKESEFSYRLRTRSEALQGTNSGVFIGGTENFPYIEIGSTVAAQTIPDDIVILWDNPSTTPGAGWVDITSTFNNRFIVINSSSEQLTAASTHSHTASGTLGQVSIPIVATGDQGGGNNNDVDPTHTHTFSIPTNAVSSEPRHIKLRAFKSLACLTTEFPDGAILMWDQQDVPTGWQSLSAIGASLGHYVKIGSSGLNTPIISSHSHTISGTSSARSNSGESSAGNDGAAGTHAHSVNATLGSTNLSNWELNHVSLHLIKKVGESDTWDGSNKLIYALVAGISDPTGWTPVSTYDGKFLKVGNTVPTIGSAANSSHTHTFPTNVLSGVSSPLFGNANPRTYGIDDHTHPVLGSVNSQNAGNPAQVTFRLMTYPLGKMKSFNDAITNQYTAGTWTSPAQQINAGTMLSIFWNESIADTDNDNIEIFTRSGATEAACLSASFSSALTNPNGSIIETSADAWFQFSIEFTAADTRITNPRVFFANAYVVKYTYERESSAAEDSVNWRYKFGFRNFDKPMSDKTFKSMATVHEGSQGSFNISWETENGTNSFDVSLASYPDRWESYFHDTALGKEIDFELTKNDLFSFRLSEIKGLFSPQPTRL